MATDPRSGADSQLGRGSVRSRALCARRRLFRQFLLIDAAAFVVLSAISIAIGAPEAIAGIVGGYILGFQTGGAS